MIFECHITCTVERAFIATQVANQFHWKTSEIARDPVLGDDTYFYLTTHGDDYIKVFNRMRYAVEELRARGVEVVREKIELIMYDTKVKV